MTAAAIQLTREQFVYCEELKTHHIPAAVPSLASGSPCSRRLVHRLRELLLLPQSPFATFGDLQTSQIERTKNDRERESLSAQEKVPPLLPHLALSPHHPLTSDCALCSAVLGSKISPAGRRRRLREREKDWIFRAMEAWPDPFRPGRWGGFLSRSDSYRFK